MRGEPWSDMDLQELYEVVNDPDWFEVVRPFLPTRSDAAIRTRMCQLRLEAGIVPHRNGPRSRWSGQTTELKAQQGSDALRRKIMEMAA